MHSHARTLPASVRACASVLACASTLFLASVAHAQIEAQPHPDDEAKAKAKVAPPPTLEKPPAIVTQVDPIYPDEARAANRAGDVVLRITIGADGTVERVDVMQSAGDDDIGHALDFAAMGAAANFVFTPATFCFTDVLPDGSLSTTPRCGVPGRVAIDYKTTFALEEKHVEVPTEAATPPATTANPNETNAAPAVEAVLNYVGVVREAGTKDPLEGVNVEVDLGLDEHKDPKTMSTTTDAEGRFEMRGIPDGNWRVNFTQSGYEPAYVDETFSAKVRTETVIYLVPSDTSKNETVVRRKRADKDVAKVELTRDEVKRVPGTFGDPLRVIENLPGLARAPFIGGELIVRGANPEDSGVYFDGVEIPLLYHFGGLKSVVNAEFLEDISFYPGGFGAYYGRATGGIVDVSSRKLKLNQFRGSADVNLMDADFFFAGPIQIGELPKLTFAVAARRSYIDALLPIALDAVVGPQGQAIVAAPVYYDYQAKVETDPIPDNHFSLFMFGSDDDLKVLAQGIGNQSLDVGFHEQFHRLLGSWDWKLAPGLTHRFAPFVGLTRIEFQGNRGNNATGTSTNAGGAIDTWNWGLRDQLQLDLNDAVVFRTGLDYLGQTFGVNFNVPIPIEIGSFPREFARITGSNQTFSSSGFNNASGVYVEAELSPWKNVKIVPGVRAELTIFTFLPNKLPDGTTSDPAAAQLFHVDPRLTARWEFMPWTTVKGAFGVYREPPQPEQINATTGNPNLLEPRAVQLIGGIEQKLTKDINLDVQLYYTNRDLLVQDTGATKNANDGSGKVTPLFFNNGGRGRTIGAELLLRHEITEHFYGWIAYTLSRTEQDLDENRDRFTITDNDQTHILTIVAQTNLPYGFTVGARYRLVSGDPTNVPLGSVHDLDTTDYLQLGTTTNSTRLPTFHQLDVRVDKKFVFETFSLTAYLDVLNVYNQANAEGFVTDYRSRTQQAIPSLPVLPVLGASGEF